MITKEQFNILFGLEHDLWTKTIIAFMDLERKGDIDKSSETYYKDREAWWFNYMKENWPK